MANNKSVKSFAFWKMNVKLFNFRVPVYKGVPLPWMKWNRSFQDDCWPSMGPCKLSLSEKWMLNHTTLGLLFIRGLSYHEWNETYPSTITTAKLYDWNVSLSECTVETRSTFKNLQYNRYLGFRTLYMTILRHNSQLHVSRSPLPIQETNDLHPLTMTRVYSE